MVTRFRLVAVQPRPPYRPDLRISRHFPDHVTIRPVVSPMSVWGRYAGIHGYICMMESIPQGNMVDLGERGSIYVRQRSGPPGAPTVLLLHGLTATGKLNWFTSIDELATAYNVIIPDHRGHGHGLKTREPFSLEACADDAAAVLSALGVEQAVCVGYSMGGPIAQLMWARHPEKVAGLVMCSTAARFPHAAPMNLVFPFADMFPDLLPRGAPSWVPSILEKVGLGTFSEMVRHDPRALRQAVRSLARYDGRDSISRITVPSAAVITTHDRLVPRALQEEMAGLMPACRVQEIPADHLVCVTHPKTFSHAVREACDDVVARGMSKPSPSVGLGD